MIDKALPTHPISKFRQSGNEILDELEDGPVLLTQHGIGAGVLLSIELYNNMVAYIRAFSDAELIRRRLLEMNEDESAVVNFADFSQSLQRRGLIDAE